MVLTGCRVAPQEGLLFGTKEKISLNDSLYFLRRRDFKLVAHGETCSAAQNSTDWGYLYIRTEVTGLS